MTSQYGEEDLYDEDGNLVEPQGTGGGQPEAHTNAEWATLRREKRERGKAEERAKTAEKELAFMRAGIDASTNPMAAYFVKGYDGDITPEAIRAKALEVGLIQAPPPPEPDPVKQASLAAGERIATTAQGGGEVTPKGTAALDEAYAQGGTSAMIQVAREMGIPIQNED
jgi:hypothetical protein